MARLREEFLQRVESFGDRMLDLVDALERKRVRERVLAQMTGSGTSVGANAYEAAEAVSRNDFCKCVGICVKELSESRYWIRLSGRRAWVKPGQLKDLERESVELAKIFGSMLSRTRQSRASTRTAHS